MADADGLLRTSLHGLHAELGARLVAFAGYEMPLHYKPGIMAEHLHTRSAAGLFDVSHMGQIRIRARSGGVEAAALALERLVPADLLGLRPGRQRYTLLTDPSGGILDDLMVARLPDSLLLVVNAAGKQADLAHLRAALDPECSVEPLFDRALLAVQGPQAEAAVAALAPEAAALRFMEVRALQLGGIDAVMSRSGYTGEDGYEIGVSAADAEPLARLLLAQPGVAPIGLGARDSLRLEAGLCLYGTDIDRATSPVEAGLDWSIAKIRRAGGERQGGFPGAEIVLHQLAEGTSWRRVGLLAEGRAPLRAGAPLFADAALEGEPVGRVTSGAFGPSLNAPVAMARVRAEFAEPGRILAGALRGRAVSARVAPMPFIATGYKRPSGGTPA